MAPLILHDVMLFRRQYEIAVRQSSVPYTTKRIAAARKRRFQAELRDIEQRLLHVKQLTETLSNAKQMPL